MKSSFFHKMLVTLTIPFFACIVTSCHDEEVANIKELAYRHNYESNFVKLYGEISPDQTWDFSSYALNKSHNNAITRADYSEPFGIPLEDGRYRVPIELCNWIKANVMEDTGNSLLLEK